MAEKKEHKIVSADTGEEMTAADIAEAKEKAKEHKIVEAAPVGNATAYRAGAIGLWVLAIVFEVLALLVLLGKINLHFLPTLWQLIIFLVLDLAAVIAGSQLWKKANHIKPASEKNKVLFWLWNNMGVIVACIAFIPLIILILINKDIDKKTKVIATVVAIIALLIGGAASIDYNPVSQEQLVAAQETLADENVYWTRFGGVYHTHEDCYHLNRSDTLVTGTVEQAIAAKKTRLCKNCATLDDITGIETDNAAVDEAAIQELEESLGD